MASVFTVQDLPPAERPRERLLVAGIDALSAVEILALVLGRGSNGQSVLTCAQLLLAKFGSLAGVVNASLAELQTIKGLGVAKAAQLKACLEICRRVAHHDASHESVPMPADVLTMTAAVVQQVRRKLRSFTQEQYVVISCDSRQRLLAVDVVGLGTVSASLVHPRETYSVAIQHRASSIMVAHNHPSGDTAPSGADIAVTQRLLSAGQLLGIELLDHLIITKTAHFSFRTSDHWAGLRGRAT